MARPVEAERRQLTVLFCDLVGSTELAARLDPEDLRDVMRAYQAACADVIGRFEGHLARFLGDGVLAYFGWPRAHENDAERAVRAGLQLIEDIARLQNRAGVRLQARVGVATGHVVVGDLISEGASEKDAVSGETPNLAARLQALAAPGSVVISTATRRLLGDLFELADLGPHRLKGFAEPLAIWQVVREGHAKGRFEALHGAQLTPLVGREEEIALLLRHWQRAPSGERARWCCCSASRGWQVQDRAGAARRPRGRALCFAPISMLAPSHDQTASSGHRADGTRRRLRTRRFAGGAPR